MSAEVERMFAVRQPTWHGLEELLQEPPSIEVAPALAGHAFKVNREPLYRQVIQPDGTALYSLYEEVELNVRDDTGLVLDAVPAERVEIQPQEMWDLIEWMLQHVPNLQLETAGTLNQGKNIWALLKRDQPLTVKGDPQGDTLPFLCLQNGYVKDQAFRLQQIFTRVVCWNTSQLADVEAERNNFNYSLHHTQNLWERIEEVKDALLQWEAETLAWQAAKEHMATVKVTPAQTSWFVDEFLPMPHVALTSERVKENVELARIELISEMFSERGTGLEHTALGLFEAASSWNEHIRKAQTPQSRFKRAVLSRDSVLTSARELALASASV